MLCYHFIREAILLHETRCPILIAALGRVVHARIVNVRGVMLVINSVALNHFLLFRLLKLIFIVLLLLIGNLRRSWLALRLATVILTSHYDYNSEVYTVVMV